MTTPDGLDRSKGWVTVLTLSILILIVFLELIDVSKTKGGKERYIIACCSFGIIFGFIFTTAAYVERLKSCIYGNVIETTFAVLNMVFWCVGVGILQSPKNGFATQIAPQSNTGAASDAINNANLYFGTWIVFAASASIIASILKDKGLFDAKISWAAMSKTMSRWFLLLVSSMVVLITSALLQTSDADNADTKRRRKYAVSVGAICVSLPFLIILCAMFKCTIGIMLQLLLSILCVALYCVEVGAVTSPKGPGYKISNLYFSSWIGFIVSISLFMSVMDDFKQKGANAVSATAQSEQDGGYPSNKDDEPATEDVDL